MIAYRIADGRFPVYSDYGALHSGGRWNSRGRGVIYAASGFATAIVEKLVHTRIGKIPKNHMFVVITIPDDIAIENAFNHPPKGWDAPDMIASRAFGDRWLEERRTAVLLVPSLPAREDRNVLINPAHPDFSRIMASKPRPVIWDERLFGERLKKPMR